MQVTEMKQTVSFDDLLTLGTLRGHSTIDVKMIYIEHDGFVHLCRGGKVLADYTSDDFNLAVNSNMLGFIPQKTINGFN